MKTKTALLLMFFAVALGGCAGSKKARCSCPNFRGSRAIFGKADVEVQDFKIQEREVQWR